MTQPKPKRTGRKPKTKSADESATSSAKSPTTSDDETDNQEDFITIAILEEVLAKHLQPIHKSINEAITKLQTDLDSVRQIAENALKLAEKKQQNNRNTSKLQLHNENTHLKSKR